MRLFKSMSIKWLILPAFILLVLPNGAFADSNYSACDLTATFPTAGDANPYTQCPSSTTIPAFTLYAFDFEFSSAPDSSMWYKSAQSDSPSLCQAISWTQGTGIRTIVLTTPITFSVQTLTQFGILYNSSSCSSPSNNLIRYSGTSPLGHQILYTTADYSNPNTRIDYTIPSNGATGVATSSPITLEAGGYINSSYGDLTNVDHNEGIRVKWRIQNATNVLTANVNCEGTDLNCPLGFHDYYSYTGYASFVSQTFNVSTTTISNLATGYYRLTTSIIKPSSYFGLTGIFGISFGSDTIVSTSTTFSAGTPTAQQTQLFNLVGASNSGLATMLSTTTAVSLNSCNPFSLDLGLCLNVLFFPSSSDIQQLIQFAKDNVLTRAPWGYATRMVSILTDTATTTASTALPTWTVTFPSIQGSTGSPLAGSHLTFNMQEMLDNGSTTLNGITDPVSGKNMRQVIEPYILLFIAISALIIMFHDVMGMGTYHKKYADH